MGGNDESGGAGLRWHRALPAAELPTDGSGTCLELAGRLVALFRLEDGVRALDDTCPHQAGSLGLGVATRGEVTCPWHGFHFALDSGRSTDGLDLCVEVHPARVSGSGWVEVALPEAPPGAS